MRLNRTVLYALPVVALLGMIPLEARFNHGYFGQSDSDSGAEKPTVSANGAFERLHVKISSDFQTVIDLSRSGSFADASRLAALLQNQDEKNAAQWLLLRSFPQESGRERLSEFLAHHPDWPSAEWIRNRLEESYFREPIDPVTLRAQLPAQPQTNAGKLAAARLLISDGQLAEAAQWVTQVWRTGDLPRPMEGELLKEFAPLLDKADYKFRADRLAYKGRFADAQRIAQLAGPDVVALLRARSAIEQGSASDALLAALPQTMKDDPSLLFANAVKLRRAGKLPQAAELHLKAPTDPELLVSHEEWWVERRVLARAVLDDGDPELAYRLCTLPLRLTRESDVEQALLAGWIALRFNDDPARALLQFDHADDLALMPHSKAKAGYWRARALEAAGQIYGAQATFTEAAKFPTAFYGQLAMSRAGQTTVALREPPAASIGQQRPEALIVAETLMRDSDNDPHAKELASGLLIDSARHFSNPADLTALSELVLASGDAHLAVVVGKLAHQRGLALDEAAFPVFGIPAFSPLSGSAALPLVYATARQESAFAVQAVSGAGAKGLMQMMLPTARETAANAKVPFDADRLASDGAFNAQLGAAHLGGLLQDYNGFSPLAFAAYNAGKGRVHEWINLHGDPRDPTVDPIDWIELIPIAETRDYVQHILENAQIYRLRLQQDPTLTTNDELKANIPMTHQIQAQGR